MLDPRSVLREHILSMLAMNVQYLRPPFTEGGVLVPRRSVLRQPGYLPYTRRRAIGFARPPHDGFAFSRRTRGCAYLQAHSPETLAMSAHHTVTPSPTQYPLEGFPPRDDAPRVALCHALSCPPYYQGAMNSQCSVGNSREAEVCRRGICGISQWRCRALQGINMNAAGG